MILKSREYRKGLFRTNNHINQNETLSQNNEELKDYYLFVKKNADYNCEYINGVFFKKIKVTFINNDFVDEEDDEEKQTVISNSCGVGANEVVKIFSTNKYCKDGSEGK